MSKKSLSNYNYDRVTNDGFEIEDDEVIDNQLSPVEKKKRPRKQTEVISARIPASIAKHLKKMGISPAEAFKVFCENELMPKKKCPRCGQDIKP